MKTHTLRQLIIAGSLGICAITNAGPSGISLPGTTPDSMLRCDNFDRPPEITRPVLPRIPPFRPGPVRPAPPIRLFPIAKPVGLSVSVCLPCPLDEKLKMMPRQVPVQDITVRNLLSVTGTDNGCVVKPGKPTQPAPSPRPRPII